MIKTHIGFDTFKQLYYFRVSALGDKERLGWLISQQYQPSPSWYATWLIKKHKFRCNEFLFSGILPLFSVYDASGLEKRKTGNLLQRGDSLWQLIA